jgi:hypothetical protein
MLQSEPIFGAIRGQSNWLEEIATYLNIGEFYRLRIYLKNLF